MVRTRRQNADVRGAPIQSAIEHPVVWDFVGKGRYLQASVSKFYAQLYSSRFDSITSKNLSNIAAETGVLPLMSWTRSIGCNWGESVFLSAVKGGRTETLEYLMSNDCPIPQGEDACTCAAKEGKLEVLMWLRQREAAWGEAVCTQAAAGGFLQLLQWAVDNSCPCNRTEALEKAAGAGHLHILDWARNLHGDEMLTSSLCASAAKGGRLSVLQRLRSWNCPWEADCIWLAVAQGRVDVYQWAKTNGCIFDVNEDVGDGITLLNLAILAGQIEFVRILIADGVSVHHSKPSNESSCLHLAVECNRPDIGQVLISAGANVNARDRNSITPLCTAIPLGHLEFIEVLCDAGADIELCCKRITPLILAATGKLLDVIRLLIAKGAKVNSVGEQGFSALHLARVCQMNAREAALALIQGGADVNMTVRDGGSPLKLAIVLGCRDLVAFLLEHGANINLSGPEGMTPLALAIITGHHDIVETLIAGGCNLNACVGKGSYLNIAVRKGNLDIVQCLVRGGVEVNPAVPPAWRPLNVARQSGFVEIAAFLAEAGARE